MTFLKQSHLDSMFGKTKYDDVWISDYNGALLGSNLLVAIDLESDGEFTAETEERNNTLRKWHDMMRNRKGLTVTIPVRELKVLFDTVSVINPQRFQLMIWSNPNKLELKTINEEHGDVSRYINHDLDINGHPYKPERGFGVAPYFKHVKHMMTALKVAKKTITIGFTPYAGHDNHHHMWIATDTGIGFGGIAIPETDGNYLLQPERENEPTTIEKRKKPKRSGTKLFDRGKYTDRNGSMPVANIKRTSQLLDIIQEWTSGIPHDNTIADIKTYCDELYAMYTDHMTHLRLTDMIKPYTFDADDIDIPPTLIDANAVCRYKNGLLLSRYQDSVGLLTLNFIHRKNGKTLFGDDSPLLPDSTIPATNHNLSRMERWHGSLEHYIYNHRKHYTIEGVYRRYAQNPTNWNFLNPKRACYNDKIEWHGESQYTNALPENYKIHYMKGDELITKPVEVKNNDVYISKSQANALQDFLDNLYPCDTVEILQPEKWVADINKPTFWDNVGKIMIHLVQDTFLMENYVNSPQYDYETFYAIHLMVYYDKMDWLLWTLSQAVECDTIVQKPQSYMPGRWNGNIENVITNMQDVLTSHDSQLLDMICNPNVVQALLEWLNKGHTHS